LARAGEKDRVTGAEATGHSDDGASRSRKSVSLAKTMRPGLLGVVQREKLFERMDQGAKRGVIWVAGPPGAGKTTLVSSYIEHLQLSHLWYQVDRGDVDAATFFHYMGLAASRESSLDGSVLPATSSGRGGDVVAFSQRYFRELYRCLTPPFALVFDNYQEAPLQSPLPLIINTALEEIPRSGFVVVISRSEPPRELARLRANQRIEIIDWSDLRLSPEELQSMARRRGQTLTDEASRSLHQRTQGWAAGAVLMLEHAKVTGTEADPPGDNTPQVIFDYVAGEIFDKFEATSQAFLLSTACLSQMTPDTAEKVSGFSKAGPLLANLARNDYFVSERRADGERVYQFHRLLSDFLRTRAKQVYAADEWTKLVRRSARLLAEVGQADDAISLLLDESHWEDATALIVANAPETLSQGRAETLMGWLDELPPAIAAANPWVLYWQAASRRSNAPRESRRYYERAYEGFRVAPDPDPEGMMLTCCGIIDAIVRELDDLSLLDTWIGALEELWSAHQRALPEHVERHVVRSMLMSLLLRRPGYAGYENWLEIALNLCRQSSGETLRGALQPVVALALMWAGRYPQAADLINTARVETANGDSSDEAVAQLAYVDSVQRLFAGSLTASGRLNGDRQETERADEPTPENRPPIHRVVSHLNAGELDQAEALLGEMSNDPASARRLERGLSYYLQAWLSMWRDDKLDAYRQVQTALGVATEIGSPAFELICRLAWAETLAVCGDLRKAESQLRRGNELLQTLGNPLLEFMAGLTTARVALDAGQQNRAIEALRQSLTVGRSYGFTHSLWWRPNAMAELCALALAEDIEADYVRHLIHVRRITPGASAMKLRSWPWHFQLFTLGKFRLLKEGTMQNLVNKGSMRPLELLKVLVALGGRDVRVEHLTDILWPNIDGDYAYGSFTSALHRLRRLLDVDDAITLQDGRLSLNARYFWVDTWAIEQVFANEEPNAAASLSCRALATTAERLLELYRGAFLEDESESTRYVALREHLRGKMLRLLTKIARHCTDSEQIEATTSYYERVIDADPLCEGFYRNLMTLYDTLGRRPEALDVYNRCRTILTSTLRVTPSSETVALYEKLSHENSAS
jgi:DNA-binding SARP family transcriptional activator/predicted ATPase